MTREVSQSRSPTGSSGGAGPADPTATRVHELEARLAQVERKLHGIEQISRSLGSEHNLDRILEGVMERTTALLDADRATLFVVDAHNQRLWSKVLQGHELREIELPLGGGIAGWVAQHGRGVNVKDAYEDRRFDPEFDRRSNFRTRSILCLPLNDPQGRTIGVIQVLNKRDGYFTTADEDLLAAIASQAAISIQNSKLYLDIVGKNIDLQETQLRLQERTAELELLFAVERAAATATTRETALAAVLDVTLEELPCEVGAVILLDSAADTLTYAATRGPLAERVHGARGGLGEGAVGRAIVTGEPVVVTPQSPPELTEALLESNPGWKIRSLVCVPISHAGERLGCLELINCDHGAFDEDEVRILGMIAGRIALSLVLAQALEEEQKAERLAAIGQMLSSVVHDLKTPLTIINGYAQLMAKDATPETRAHYKQLIKNQVEDIKSMITELLAFARGESKVLMRKAFVKPFLDDITEQLSEEFVDSPVNLVVDAAYRGTVRMDSGKMKRVITNLARNAREAMPAGGTFRISVEELDGQVRFSFADDGPGLPEALEGRLFEPFATFGKRNGTGLGLAIVKKIVEEHQGSIAVESAPGQGTTFRILLPIG